MACTTIPLTPDRHRPLHTQVTQLREERVSLIEKLDNQKYEIVELKKALQVAAEKQQQAEAARDESDERRRRAEEELAESKATSSQLLAAAGAWQARLSQEEHDHLIKESTDQAQWSRAAAQSEQERLRLFNDLSAAVAERRKVEDFFRQANAEATSMRQLLEAQRDEALGRAWRAEDALAIAISENRFLTERLAHQTTLAADEQTRREAAEQRCAQVAQRADDLAKNRIMLEQERAQASEALALALNERRQLDLRLHEERLRSMTSVSREEILRWQVGRSPLADSDDL